MVRIEVKVRRDRNRKAVIIGGPEDVRTLLCKQAAEADSEKFWAIPLDSKNAALGVELVSLGTASASLVHPRETWKSALILGATAIVVAHVHPSGDPAPSPEDKTTTRRLVEAGKILGVPLIDHVILANGTGRFFSFREHGLI